MVLCFYEGFEISGCSNKCNFDIFQLDKFNTFRGKEKRDRKNADRNSYRTPDDLQIESAMGMSDKEINEKFEEMLVSKGFAFYFIYITYILLWFCYIRRSMCMMTSEILETQLFV